MTYVEALPELTPKELQEEAQEEARVFASLGKSFFFLLSLALCQNNGASVLLIGGRANTGLVDQLLQTLKGIDPARGDKLDDRPEIEEMYQASVALQGQINTLIKKYSDQKGEF